MTNQEKFENYMHDVCSPRHFIRWNYLFSISSILARKVWLTDIDALPVFPNLYVVVVAPPGVGKSVVADITKKKLAALKSVEQLPGGKNIIKNLVTYSPDTLSIERLIESMANKVDSLKISDGPPPKFYIHSSMTFLITEELTVLFKSKQESLVDFLTSGWNCGEFKQELKTNNQRYNIRNMCINFMGCTTVERLAKCVNSDLISQGFTARTIFLYADKKFHIKAGFNPTEEAKEGFKDVEAHWKKLGKLLGQITISPEASEWYDNWLLKESGRVLNKDKKLEDYYGRKDHHLKKLAIVMHYREKTTMVLDVEDFVEAKRELELNEMDMHKALRSLGRNPIHTLAEDIKRGLEHSTNGGMSSIRILATYFDGGNAEEIKLALEHKVTVGEFRTYNKGNLLMYQINREEEEAHES